MPDDHADRLVLMRVLLVVALSVALPGCAVGPAVMALSAAASLATISRDAVQIDEALGTCDPSKAPPYFKWIWKGCR